MTEPQHGCDHAIRNDDNRNLFECMYVGDCIHKQVIDRRPLLYRCHCITAKESSDKVLDELEKRVEENGSLYLQASAFFRWIKELRTKER